MLVYKEYVMILSDAGTKDEIKLKAAQELSENLEVVISQPYYPIFLEYAVKAFLEILHDGEVFIAEHSIQQLRKLILELIHRLPSNDNFYPYVRGVIKVMMNLLRTENEENVLLCLRIIIDLLKHYRPTFSSEIHSFLEFVKRIYQQVPNRMDKIFEPCAPIKVTDIRDVDIETLLNETFTVTTIHSQKQHSKTGLLTYNLIPKGTLSLKVLQELPIMVVLMYQLYKNNIMQDVTEFIPIAINIITLQPTSSQRCNPNFNREMYVDFVAVQIKSLSFLAYMVRVYTETVGRYVSLMVKAVINLLAFCPPEVANLRKELIIATRHILSTELRTKFIPSIDCLLNENILLGKGWTTHKTLRPLAYGTLADLVHHLRSQLTLPNLSRVVHLFSIIIHDEFLPMTTQTMSCKLLLNLVDCIRAKSDFEGGNGRELLLRLLQVFVMKFKVFCKKILPVLVTKCANLGQATGTVTLGQPEGLQHTNCITAESTQLTSLQLSREKKSKYGFSVEPFFNYNVTDCRNMVKTLVYGAKTITWNCTSCKCTSGEVRAPSKHFQPKEVRVFVRLVKWALQAVDIYLLSGMVVTGTQKSASHQAVHTKEEKEVLEHFCLIYQIMTPQNFQEIFSHLIDYLVERMSHNSALQVVVNSFLSNPTTSPLFGAILLHYLLGHMTELGGCGEKSNLYLRLFRLVFGSISLLPTDNEHTLRPHLRKIVNLSMDLALTAKEPYNLFLLLRALFRSIGGGGHDLLYQEFLPLLPNILQGLNNLQSGFHKQHMKDLFVELCLTVPVRLSSLLPYLPLLMDPLVSALNGSQSLLNQGLRTLELCVDNLQPDQVYELIEPVRANVMQALWRTLCNPSMQVAQVAFRLLGKFGGGNRKTMMEPQHLDYNDKESIGTCILIHFLHQHNTIEIPIEKVIETASAVLMASNTDSYCKKHSWEVIRCYLIASLSLDDDKNDIELLFSHPSFTDPKHKIAPIQTMPYKMANKHSRATHQKAVTAMFVAAAVKELRLYVMPTLMFIVNHYTMVAIAQQAGPFPLGMNQAGPRGMDTYVLIDSLADIMSHEEKELCKPGHLAMVLIVESATNILGSEERACCLPFMEYLAERMCSLCYEQAWYAKLGGCIAIKFLLERMALHWIFKHLFVFLRSLLFVMMDLTGEVSCGAVDMAKSNLENLLSICAIPVEGEDIVNCRTKSLHTVTEELVRQVVSPFALVREQVMHSLEVLAKIQHKTVTAVMEPHKEIIDEMIPPKKYLLCHQSANIQIGIIDGMTFCTSLEPRLFTIDMDIVEHKVFFEALLSLCELDDTSLNNYSCCKAATSLVTLCIAAYRALAACHYITGCRDKILFGLYKALEKENIELQEAAFQCLKTFIGGFQIDIEMVHSLMRPLFVTLGDQHNLTLNGAKSLAYLTTLFPVSFNDSLLEQLLQLVKKLLQSTIGAHKGGIHNFGENEKKVETIVDICYHLSAISPNFFNYLCKLILDSEKTLMVETMSPYRSALVRLLLRFPQQTVDLFLHEDNIKDQQWNRYLEFMIKHEDGKPLREVLQNSVPRLITLALAHTQNKADTEVEKGEMQYMSIRITSLLIKFDAQWLSLQHHLINTYRTIWTNNCYLERHMILEDVESPHWKEPKLLVRILLRYFAHHTNEIDLLFQLLQALCKRLILNFQFLYDFLENTVSKTYTVEWKRATFFRFVEYFQSSSMTQDLKAKILEYILIPCFAASFKQGEGEKVIGGPPMPDQESTDNCVSVFINQVIDPDHPFANSEAVRIFLLRFSCILVEHAAPHIHDSENKRQGAKVRRLLMFAWPCLLGKVCVDPATKYHGHILLAHIIAKFAIHKRLKLQVFHSLLRAHSIEAQDLVRHALDILTPLIPEFMEDGYTMLTHWTKKMLVEEGHSVPQLVHIMQLVTHQYKVYYPVRHYLVQHMVTAMQRLGLNPSGTIDQRRLAVEVAEVIIKWELLRINDQAVVKEGCDATVVGNLSNLTTEVPGCSTDNNKMQPDTMATAPGLAPPKLMNIEPDNCTPIERVHCNAVLGFLIRMACQVNELSVTLGSRGEVLSRHCVGLFKVALKQDIWSYSEDLQLVWLDKVLISVHTASPNYGNICTALNLFTYLFGIMKAEKVLASVKPLQRSLAACMTCSNVKVIHLVHCLMVLLLRLFPTTCTPSNVTCKYEELESLYSSMTKVLQNTPIACILHGLTTYEKSTNGSTASLYGPLMMLKAACLNNETYIDSFITPFMKVLQMMTREHLHPMTCDQPSWGTGCELLLLCLELIKNRIVVMAGDIRKIYIGSILVALIEKTQENKIMRAITKMLETWIKNKNAVVINQKEKLVLLVKLMLNVEKRFPDDLQLNAQYLEIINFVFRDETLNRSELTCKLEPAFMQGLRCTQPAIRSKFFEVVDMSIKRRLHDRLLYIIVTQNWETIGPHFWIKQCIELLLQTAKPGEQMRLCGEDSLLPPITHCITTAEATDKSNFVLSCMVMNTEGDSLEISEVRECDPGVGCHLSREQLKRNRKESRKALLTRHSDHLDSIRGTCSVEFLTAMVQLCHMDTKLAEHTWLNLFPCVWNILTDTQKTKIAAHLKLFLASGAHVLQKDCQPSALHTFVEGLILCHNPTISIDSTLMKYLGRSHNLWHCMTLNLEQLVLEAGKKRDHSSSSSDVQQAPMFKRCSDLVSNLSEMYMNLCEEDMWSGLWQKHARFIETNIGIVYETQGFFQEAMETYELVIGKMSKDYNSIALSPLVAVEMKIWEDRWIRCSKELNEWGQLMEYASDKTHRNPGLIVESSWRVSKWTQMQEALNEAEHSCSKDYMWKINLYRGYVALCSEDKHLNMVERYVEMASGLCMYEWRRLPSIVSQVHLPILQAAQQIMELQEAGLLHQSLHSRSNSVYDIKAILKAWRNRLPSMADDLSHWSDIYAWRHHHFAYITSHQDQGMNHSMLGVHASAQTIIHFGKIARKHGLSLVCMESLTRIYDIPSVPVLDCFHKIRQQVKCYLDMSTILGLGVLQEGLEVIETTNLKYFTKDMTAEFLAYKGMLLTQLGHTEAANKAFSCSVRLNDHLTMSWGLWGEYLEVLFTNEPTNMSLAQWAITCLLHACQHQSEIKSRKYLVKVLWLLSYENSKLCLAEIVDKFQLGIPHKHWLPWVPQLLTYLTHNEGTLVLNLLNQIGCLFPQSVYFPIRTLYATLKAALNSKQDSGNAPRRSAVPSWSSVEFTRASPAMSRCSQVLHSLREMQPIVLCTLECIVDQLVCFRENWYEEVLGKLHQALTKCWIVAFGTHAAVSEATITPHILEFLKMLVSNFGIGIDSSSLIINSVSEKLTSREQSIDQDPVLNQMKKKFSNDFNFSESGVVKIAHVISKLHEWINILEVKVKVLPKSFLLEEKCRFLSNFSLQMADIELPGEFLLPRNSSYYVRIAQFMPRVDIVHKHNLTARRLYIRGNNGKIYPYLVLSDSILGDVRHEERILQLTRMLNNYLVKHKETSRRFLHFTVPRVIPVSKYMRLVEDNLSSISLMDIYKQSCVHVNKKHEDPIVLYYDRVALIQAQGSQPSIAVLRAILHKVQSDMVPPTLLKDWAVKTFPGATEYWTFRKMFTLQLSLACFCEYVFHLTRLDPHTMYLHQDSGLIDVPCAKFDVDDMTGNLDSNRIVPFRLTPNIVELVTMTGINGPLTSSMIAMARCLEHPKFNIHTVIKVILRDEMIASYMEEQESTNSQAANMETDLLIGMVTHASSAMMTRLKLLAKFDGVESKVGALVGTAMDLNNLCRMNPAWHPWL